jgi:protein-S-isoprenylcysteine O-methyltransferase Ste14
MVRKMSRKKEDTMRDRFAIQMIEYGAGILFILQVLLSYLFYRWVNIAVITYFGWILLFLGCGFFILPGWDFKRRGKSPEGKSVVRTTVVVDSGFYSVVRHPMYLGWVLIILGLVLMSLHMVTVIIGIPSMVLAYQSMFMEEEMNIKKFGDAYRKYMETVPRMNIIKGILNRRSTSHHPVSE